MGLVFFFFPLLYWLGDFSRHYSVDLGQAHEAESVVGRGWDFWIRTSGFKCVSLPFHPLVKSFSFSEFSFLICKILILIMGINSFLARFFCGLKAYYIYKKELCNKFLLLFVWERQCSYNLWLMRNLRYVLNCILWWDTQFQHKWSLIK